LRFSIQCGASNRKALITRRCSQCIHDQPEAEPVAIPNQHRHPSCSHRSSSGSMNFTSTLQPPLRHRTTVERTSDLDKFDTLLMLAAERTSRLDSRNKQQQHHHSPTSSQKRAVPLLIIEQQASNHTPRIRASHKRFTKSAESSARSSLRIPHHEDDNVSRNSTDASSGSVSSTNLRLPLRVSRL
ncbi:unnamed protein product, partial [Adineta steineri]